MTNPCYIRKVKSKETWLNATNSNHITWPLNQPGEKGSISSQHQSNVILPAVLLLAANTTHPQNPPTSIRTKQGWPRSGSTWELNGTADLRHVQLTTVQRLQVWYYMEQPFVHVWLTREWHQMEVLPQKPPGSSQTLTEMHLLPALLHFREFAHFNSQKEDMIDG